MILPPFGVSGFFMDNAYGQAWVPFFRSSFFFCTMFPSKSNIPTVYFLTTGMFTLLTVYRTKI
jgi:hypothetical protein